MKKDIKLKTNIKKPKTDEVIEAISFLSNEAKKYINSLEVKDTRIKSDKQIFAEKNHFLYQEISGRIYLTYDSKHYLMPIACNNDYIAFNFVVKCMVDYIKPTADKSIVPKVE